MCGQEGGGYRTRARSEGYICVGKREGATGQGLGQRGIKNICEWVNGRGRG